MIRIVTVKMSSIVFLFLTLASTQAFPQLVDDHAGHPYQRTYKKGLGITGGQDAPPGKIPYQVGIFVDGSFFCGGSLISPNYVLTAAQCVDEIPPNTLKIELVFGASNIMDETEETQIRISATEFTFHEKWSRGTLQNDIALIKLSTPIKENDVIKIVPIATGSNLYNGSQATVAGWGFVDYQQVSDVLKYVTNPVITNDECTKLGGSFYDAFLRPTQVCQSGEGGAGPCGGDWGSPLVVDGTQVGVVSWSYDFCGRGYPTVFTRLTEYQSWIAEHSDVKF